MDFLGYDPKILNEMKILRENVKPWSKILQFANVKQQPNALFMRLINIWANFRPKSNDLWKDNLLKSIFAQLSKIVNKI